MKTNDTNKEINVLMLSTDQKIFEEGSAVRKRMIDYGGLVEELHIVIFTKFQTPNPKLQTNSKIQISKNVFVYPTNTLFKPLYFRDAYRIGKRVIKSLSHKVIKSKNDSITQSLNVLITTQDPFETGFVGYLLKRKFNLPLQIQSHSDFLSPYFWRESLKNKIRAFLGKWLIKKADGIRVVSERVRDGFITSYQLPVTKVIVLPIVFDADRIQRHLVITDLHRKYPTYNFIILVASRLTREKNVFMAIEAMAEVVKCQMSNVKCLLLIVGDGPEREALKFKVESLKLKDNVVFESWTVDIISYYKTADVFVLTSNYEGGARSPAEAAAAGLPVVMTNVPPANEIIQDGINGFVVPVGNSALLAEKIAQLIRCPNQREEFSKNALAIAQKFISREDYLLRYKESFTSLL